MKTELMTITPEMASEFIKHNTDNRPVNQPIVARYADDIASGRWQLNGDSIKFKEDGSLFDGQHRLLAIMKAQKAVESIVVTGIPNDSYVCDTQRKRTFANQVMMSGIDIPVSPKSLSAGIRLYAMLCTNKSLISDAFVMEFYETHKVLTEAAVILTSKGSSSKYNRIQHKAFCTAGYYIAMRSGFCDSDTLEIFCNVVNSGIVRDVSQNAAIMFRNILLDDSSKRTDHKYVAWELLDIMLRCIADFKTGDCKKFYKRLGLKDSTGAITKALELDFGAQK